MGRYDMKAHQIYVDKYEWYVTVYYDVTCDDEKIIVPILNLLDISESFLEKVGENIRKCTPNTGFTYTNFNLNETIIIIGATSSFDEFLNSVTHETLHACVHIMEAYGISVYGEKVCYLIGDLIQAQSGIIKEFICKH